MGAERAGRSGGAAVQRAEAAGWTAERVWEPGRGGRQSEAGSQLSQDGRQSEAGGRVGGRQSELRRRARR